jgi:protease-4
MKFLRNLLAAILGTIIALGILFIFFIGIASVMSSKEKITVQDDSVLTIELKGEVHDYVPKSDNPLDELFGVNAGKFELAQVLNAIENAKTDDKVKGISIELKNPKIGIAQLQTLRDKLIEFKESGKFVSSYSDVYTQKIYYLSSVADSLYLNPVGGIDFTGLTAEKLYFKDFQEKYGVKMEVIRHGKYKSAMEGFLADKMSEANREQTLSFLTSIWGELLADIADSRNKSIDELNNLADSWGTRDAAMSLKNNMIDGIAYPDEYLSKIKHWVGVDSDKDINTISMADYIKSGKGNIISTEKDKIAILYAQGEIMYGKGDETYIGQEEIVKALRKIKDDNNIKAIVLRVDSPGGSALASEVIWREIEITKSVKPVIVSMGNLAASGGYYIACNADKIFAEPTTITGSIGVFGAIPNIHEFTNDIGINAEQVSTNKSPNYSVFEPMTPQFHEAIKGSIDDIYQTFISHVAEGRNMSVEEVDKIGQGRVWTGKQALEIGLVDELGTMHDAINYAAELVALDKYRLTIYPRYKKDIKDAFNTNQFIKSKEKFLIEELGTENYQLYKSIEHFKNMKGIQARIPYLLKIK